MEILFKGTLPSEKIYLGVCYGCKSKIRAEHKELRHNNGRYNEECHIGTCPVCLLKGKLMLKILVCTIGCALLIWIFKYPFKVWWYTPYCIPCQVYTTYVPTQVMDDYDFMNPEDRYTEPEHYRCVNCHRRCKMEDAFRWKY